MKLFGGGSATQKAPAPVEVPEAQPHHHPQLRDDGPKPNYGIQNAILLMRTLPVDQNPELVVTVIKSTLESLKVKVTDIIEDAARRQQDIETRVASLRQQIIDFEKEIETRKAEIQRLEADHAETSTVKARLELAENGPPGQLNPAPSPAARGMRPAPDIGAPWRPVDG
jgi:hypothetical protein